MYWIAFTLGFFGSLHCIGMCGPLAIGMLTRKHQGGFSGILPAVGYNAGRTIGYIIIGILFGLIGSAMSFAGMQKVLSITLGVVMILLFLFSINPDQLISNQPFLQIFYKNINNALQTILKKSDRLSSLYLGVINGFLPCGLVYLAIAGALSLSNIWGSIGFMLFFGLGTFPAMFFIMFSHHVFHNSLRIGFRKIYPVITLLMGIYLIYRGVMSTTPLELNFYDALKNPVMCH